MIKTISIAFICCLFTSCSSLLHNSFKIQSDKRLKKTETQNFIGEKALTQWWYFDFFLEDGSVMVVLFAPYHWWGDYENQSIHKSLIYVSYMKPGGELITSNKVFDSREVEFNENSLRSPFLEIIKSHGKNSREYTLNFTMDEIKGSAKITSDIKAFSPLPIGSLRSFWTKHILKQGQNASYRYSAHVPKGRASCSLKFGSDSINLSGKAYHEQGWFTGQAHQMGEGWEWFHFASKSVNIFGARTFFYLEMNGEVLIGGLNKGDSRCELTDKVIAKNTSNFILGGSLNFSSSKLSFDVVPLNDTSTSLIYIPGDDTDELWGNIIQPSGIKITYKGEELIEKGKLIIETCRMTKVNLNKTIVLPTIENVVINSENADQSE
jgi:hypothetical protein